MNKRNFYKDLKDILLNRESHGRLIYRGNRELAVLKKWLKSDVRTLNEILSKELSLKGIISKCKKCSNVQEKKFGFGSGKNRVMIILNSPKLIDRVEKKIFREESIELLKKMVMSIGLSFGECYITNMVKCEVDESVTTPGQLLGECKEILKVEIETISPGIILVLGDIIPLRAILKESSKIFWYNIEHPITLIKNPELKRGSWNTLKIIREKLKDI